MRYENSKVFKIYPVFNHKKIYIGYTTRNYLSGVKAVYKNDFKQYLLGKARYAKYYELFKEYGVDDCVFEVIEEYPVDNVYQIRERVKYHVDRIDCVNKMPRTKEYIVKSPANPRILKTKEPLHFCLYCKDDYPLSHELTTEHIEMVATFH